MNHQPPRSPDDDEIPRPLVSGGMVIIGIVAAAVLLSVGQRLLAAMVIGSTFAVAGLYLYLDPKRQ